MIMLKRKNILHLLVFFYNFIAKKIKMGLFDKKIAKKVEQERTTSGFFIGAAEAEGEANNTKITLSEVFEDFLDILSQLNNEKFIVTGRKGSGKSAIGEYLYSIAYNEPNLFATFIKKSDIDIERIVQIGEKQGLSVQPELLFKWVILTQLLKLICQNENTSKLKEKKDLNLFLERNRGFIDIKNAEVSEIIKENGVQVNLEYFKRFYTATGSKKWTIKESKAEFYKLLPYLEETILNIMKQDTDNNYILIFDDLDIGYSRKSESSLNSLAELLRVAKYYNNEVFGRNSIISKIVILLRNDIAKHLFFNADTAKIFASYAVELNWFEEAYRSQEDNLKLKQFINKRIRANFERKGWFVGEKPWEAFINEAEFIPYGSNNKSSFKYIIDHTFFRPRDLILVFKDLDLYKFKIPLGRTDINILLGNYSTLIISEIQNELTAIFTPDEINSIFHILKRYEDKRPFTYTSLKLNLENAGFAINAEEVIEELFFYSLIGNMKESGDVIFKFREKDGEICKLDPSERFILCYILKVFFKNSN